MKKKDIDKMRSSMKKVLNESNKNEESYRVIINKIVKKHK